MANINLLPWRERLREERKQQFFIMLGVATGVALLLLFAGDRYVNNGIANQAELNQYLTQRIAELDSEIAEIRQLQEQKRALTERMAVIQDLQGTRPVIVRLFDELVRTLPEGVYYNSISRTGDIISLEGVAESNNRVSTLMRYLEDSAWFADPDLRQVTAQSNTPGTAGAEQAAGSNVFQLTVRVTTTEEQEAGQ
jgi:type IV pilus assembly protein PilN